MDNSSSSSFSVMALKTVCVSTQCEKYKTCKRSAYNNPAGGIGVSYATYGSGYATNNNSSVTFICGKAGKYAMYKE